MEVFGRSQNRQVLGGVRGTGLHHGSNHDLDGVVHIGRVDLNVGTKLGLEFLLEIFHSNLGLAFHATRFSAEQLVIGYSITGQFDQLG